MSKNTEYSIKMMYMADRITKSTQVESWNKRGELFLFTRPILVITLPRLIDSFLSFHSNRKK
jgi:hypothetical protein